MGIVILDSLIGDYIALDDLGFSPNVIAQIPIIHNGGCLMECALETSKCVPARSRRGM